jgi:uncharacterized protein (TIGR04141 family)
MELRRRRGAVTTQSAPVGATLRQLNAYMLVEGLRDPEEALKDPDALDRFSLRDDLGLEGAIYLRRPSEQRPTWMPFLEGLASEPIGKFANQHASAIVLVTRGERMFAVTFGFGRHMLKAGAIEVDFGLKVAASLIDHLDVVSLDSRAVEGVILRTRRQADAGTTAGGIGFDAGHEMLRSVTGAPRQMALGSRVTGSDGVGIHGEVAHETLGHRLDELTAAYESGAYRDRFPAIDRWAQVRSRALTDELDQELIAAINSSSHAVSISVPEVISPANVLGFRFTGEPRETLHAFPLLDDYRASRQGAPITLQHLKNHELRMTQADSEGRGGGWELYKSLFYEIERDEQVYVFAEGTWWVIARDYRDQIDRMLADVTLADVPFPDYDPAENEEDYNLRLAAAIPGAVALDQQMARFEGERGSVEPCDVFTSAGQLIHVKVGTGSKMLSHLFSQGAVSAELFRHHPPFRDQMRAALAAHAALLDLVPEGRPETRNYEVVFAITTRNPDVVPLRLPFFARANLYRMVQRIDREGFRVAVAGIRERPGARPADAGPLIVEVERARRQAAAEAKETAAV